MTTPEAQAAAEEINEWIHNDVKQCNLGGFSYYPGSNNLEPIITKHFAAQAAECELCGRGVEKPHIICGDCQGEYSTPPASLPAQDAEIAELKAENKRLKVALGETESAKPEETKHLSIPVADVCRVVQELYAIADEWSHPNPAQARGFRKAAERVSKLIPTEIP